MYLQNHLGFYEHRLIGKIDKVQLKKSSFFEIVRINLFAVEEF